ncbi:MAG: glutaredoxin [Simkaniaceae bacterium]|nr:glutaredoxin [Simkaniaceae bacterium]
MEDDHRPIVVLYYKPSCPYSKKVLDHIEKEGLEVSLKNIQTDSKAKEELLHLGGKVQVPCLFIDGKPLYESNDIIDWMKEKKDQLN